MPRSAPAYIIPSKQAWQSPLHLVGGKGKNLGRLAQIYTNVPAFFVISAVAYQDVACLLGLDDSVSRLKHNLQKNKSIDIISREIQRLWLEANFPPQFSFQVWAACREIHRGKSYRLALRSSASLEDQPDTSFAGQLESYLNIRTKTRLFSAIRACWASLWSPAAIYYQYKHNIPFTQMRVAVVVQQCIPAGASGVMFTVNPVSGSTNELMIEANWGLGVSLVQGEVTPDNYCIDREKLKILRQTIGDKKLFVHCLSGKSEGTGRADTSPAKQRRAVLSSEQVIQLAKLGLCVSRKFGAPQDIEWAIYRGKFYLLQCRPITVAKVKLKDKAKVADTEQMCWTNYFFAERFPQPVSPLSWSILGKYIEKRAFLEPLAYLGVHEFEQGQALRLFYGRPYTSLRAFQLLYRSVPDFLLPEDKKPLLTTQDLSRPASGAWFSALLSIARQDDHWLIGRHKLKWQRFKKRYLARLEEIKGMDLDKLSRQELFGLIDRLEDLTDDYLSIHRWSLTYADILYQLLRLACRKWLDDKDNRLAASLITSLEGNPTVELNAALWELSRQPKGNAYKAELDSFLERYGHCANNLDLSCPRWREDPKYILDFIRQLSKVKPEQSLPVKEQELRRLREHNTKLALDKLSASTYALLPSWRVPLFKKLLGYTQYFTNLRENQRFCWQMSLNQLRRALLALADKLIRKKIIEKDSDIFMLTKTEMFSVFNGELSPADTGRLILKRHQEQQQNQLESPPSLISPDDNGVKQRPASHRRLKGVGVSPGITSAPAIVVSNLKDYRPVQNKAILVTIGLDPGWTPLLGTVAGLVMEVGGYLSHGSIMAREFGIPAVAGISGATKLISNGESIVLDGNRGTVEFNYPNNSGLITSKITSD